MNENSESSPEIEIVVEPPAAAPEEASAESETADPVVEVLPSGGDSLFLGPEESEGEEVEFELDGDDISIVEAVEPVDSARVTELEEQVAALTTERDEVKSRMLRIAADLENFRKRTAREKEDMRKYGIDRVVLELLPVVDNLDRAVLHAGKSEDGAGLIDGVQMVVRQFLTALEKHGVKGYESKGELFDPTRHEAIQQVESTEIPNNTVMEEYQKGYFLHDRLIRPAMVSVCKNVAPVAELEEPAVEEEEEEETTTTEGSTPLNSEASEGQVEEGAEVQPSVDSEVSDESE